MGVASRYLGDDDPVAGGLLGGDEGEVPVPVQFVVELEHAGAHAHFLERDERGGSVERDDRVVGIGAAARADAAAGAPAARARRAAAWW